MQKKSTKSNDKILETSEPMGIVISSGSRHEETPRFSAYVWGPGPEPEVADDLVAVA